jgi:hypothetical protein
MARAWLCSVTGECTTVEYHPTPWVEPQSLMATPSAEMITWCGVNTYLREAPSRLQNVSNA